MNKKKEIIDIQNFDEELEYIVGLSRSIQSNFQAIVFDYTNKISNKFGESQVTTIRTDLIFRIQAVLYFVRLMKREESTVLKYINENPQLDGLNRIRLSDDFVQNQKSIFDTILYHLSSIYDYFANFSAYFYFAKVFKWNSLFNSANDLRNDKIGKNQKDLIIKSHKDFVDSLFRHRSYLIHQSMTHSGFKYIQNLGTGDYIIEVITPSKFIKEFRILNEEVGDNDISLIASIFWTVKYGLKNINDLLFGMKDELQRLRKTTEGNEIIIDNRFLDKDVSTPYWKSE